MGELASLTLEEPLDMHDAREAAQAVARNRRAVEQRLEEAIEAAATAEDAYRKAKALKIAKLRDSWPATVCADMAKGDDQVIALRHTRDVKRDIKDKLIPSQLRGIEGERALLRQLTEWSQQERVNAARAAA